MWKTPVKIGKVVSDVSDKTRTVLVKKPHHEHYKGNLWIHRIRSKKFQVHDPEERSNLGDLVSSETPP